MYFLIFAIAFTIALPVGAAASDSNPYLPPGGEHWNKLRDIQITDNGWGFGTTVTQETYLEQDARKVETNGWWADHLVINGWQSFDLSPYYENGTLEFDIVGKVGGETFDIGFLDVVHERLDENGDFYTDDDVPEETNISALVNVSDYIEVTTEWQHASIPLKHIFDSEPLFDESKIQLFKMAGNDTPITFWITNIKVTSPDKERSYAPIKVNQVGYLNYGEKYAHVSGYYNELSADVGTPFQVKRTSDNSTAYSGTLTLVAAYDELSGEKVFKADFSALNDIGEYYITVDGVAEPSVPFEIGPDVYDTLLNDVQKFFYYQRANVDLLPEHAGPFARTGKHKDDANLPLQSDPNVTKDVSGGWWDAGDTGKYVTAAATAVSDLLWAYESYPNQFEDGQLNIPESGNGIPDLLDEIKFETDFFLKMQEEQSGGFYAYVIREPVPNRYIMDGTGPDSVIPTSQTATTVGALAHAYIVFKDVPGLEEYADTLLASAVKGWNYLEAHPEFIAQPDGPYNDNDDLNDRFYAAAVLYRATGEARYSDYVVANYQAFESKFETTDFSHGIGSLELIGFYHYLSGAAPSEEVKAWFVPRYSEWRNMVIDTAINQAVWRNSTNKGFYWGANSNVASVAVSLDIGSRVIEQYDERMIQVAAGNLNYLLGINPLQLSFITGHGENRVHITHHEIYMRDFIVEMPNGYMPGGPNNNGKFNFPAKAYNQATVDWESNEQALNYNSPLIYLTALLSNVENQKFSESIHLDSPAGRFVIGETKTVTASVQPSNATFKQLVVTAADSNVATVTNVVYNEQTGKTSFSVTANNVGQTEVRVQSIDGRISAIYEVDVVSSNGASSGSSSGSTTSTVVNGSNILVEAKNSGNGAASVKVTVGNLEKALNNASDGQIKIQVNAANNLNKIDIQLPTNWLRNLGTEALHSITIETLDSFVELDTKFLKEIVQNDAQQLTIGIAIASAEDIPASVIPHVVDHAVYDFTLLVDGNIVEWTGYPITIKLPYTLQEGQNPNQVVVYYVGDELEVVRKSLFTSNMAVFQPEHFSSYTVLYSKVSFNDLNSSILESDAILAIAARGIVVGKSSGQFDPQGSLTKAEFAQMLVKFLDAADSSADSSFTDVKEGAWYYEAVAAAEKLGIAEGKTDGTFGVSDVLTREDMAALLYRAIVTSGYTLQPSGEEVPALRDAADISDYAKEAVDALNLAQVLVVAEDGSFGPKSSATRADAAQLIYNLIKAMNE
ncbi:glycoside hydrolase family 9 protein [Marinicrinis lubricantis]